MKTSMKCALLLVLPVLYAAPSLAAPIGNATAVKPQASLETLTGTVALVIGGGVETNNRVITGPIGETKLKFLDASTLDVGPNAAVTLDEFVYAGDTASKAALTMTKGTFRWVSGRSPKEAYDLKTPLATIGIRGTDFRVDTDEQRTTIRLRSGAVNACNRVSNTCASITRPGQGVHLDADGKVEMFEEREQIAPPPTRRAAAPPPAPPRARPPVQRTERVERPQRAERAPSPRRVTAYTPPRRAQRPVGQPIVIYEDDMDEYIPPRRRPPVVIVDPGRPRPPRPQHGCRWPNVPGPYGDGCVRPPRGPVVDGGGWQRPPRFPRPQGDGGWGRPRPPRGDGPFGGRSPGGRIGNFGGFGGGLR